MHDLCSILLLNFPPTICWPQSDTGGDELRGVLNAGDAGFSVVSHPETREMVCGFWRKFSAAVTDLGGNAPPRNVVETTVGTVSGDPNGIYFLSWWLRSDLRMSR